MRENLNNFEQYLSYVATYLRLGAQFAVVMLFARFPRVAMPLGAVSSVTTRAAVRGRHFAQIIIVIQIVCPENGVVRQ